MKKETIPAMDGGRDILRLTYEAADQRFYYDEDFKNTRTGKNFYPSATHILSHMPTNKFLSQWIGNKGFEEAERIKTHAGDIGRFVHECIDRMIRGKGEERIVKSIEIDTDLSPKDARKVKRCLQGFEGFWKAQQPKPVNETFDVEKGVLAQDWAGTVDLRCRIAEDDYKNVWVIDFKTSNSIHASHKAQVSAYAIAADATRAGILHLGNKTKRRWTFSEVVELDKYFQLFNQVKDTFYLMGELKEGPQLWPTEEVYPEFFAL